MAQAEAGCAGSECSRCGNVEQRRLPNDHLAGVLMRVKTGDATRFVAVPLGQA